MTQWWSPIVLYLAFLAVLLCSHGLSVAQTIPGSAPEARDMVLVGFNDLRGRSAYQPIIQQQDGRFIAYVGHHGGAALNPLNGRLELHGTSIVDVTNPQRPRYASRAGGSQWHRRSWRRTNGAGLCAVLSMCSTRHDRVTKYRSPKKVPEMLKASS